MWQMPVVLFLIELLRPAELPGWALIGFCLWRK